MLSAPFEPVVEAEQDRGSYVTRKVAFNLSANKGLMVPGNNQTAGRPRAVAGAR